MRIWKGRCVRPPLLAIRGLQTPVWEPPLADPPSKLIHPPPLSLRASPLVPFLLPLPALSQRITSWKAAAKVFPSPPSWCPRPSGESGQQHPACLAPALSGGQLACWGSLEQMCEKARLWQALFQMTTASDEGSLHTWPRSPRGLSASPGVMTLLCHR